MSKRDIIIFDETDYKGFISITLRDKYAYVRSNSYEGFVKPFYEYKIPIKIWSKCLKEVKTNSSCNSEFENSLECLDCCIMFAIKKAFKSPIRHKSRLKIRNKKRMK